MKHNLQELIHKINNDPHALDYALELGTAWMGFIQKVMQCIGDNNW